MPELNDKLLIDSLILNTFHLIETDYKDDAYNYQLLMKELENYFGEELKVKIVSVLLMLVEEYALYNKLYINLDFKALLCSTFIMIILTNIRRGYNIDVFEIIKYLQENKQLFEFEY